MKKSVLVLCILFNLTAKSQNYNTKTKYLLGTFHTKNTTIQGVSVGLIPNLNDKERFVKTNGLRLEIPGLGLLMPIGNGTAVTNINSANEPFNAKKIEFDEIVNGLNISSGTIGDIKFNGITLGLIGQYGKLSNGISASLVMNAMDKTNGIQITGLLNENIYTNGIQIAGANTSVIMSGIQIGCNNYVRQESIGLQIGCLNNAEKIIGIQASLENKSKKIIGIQIGGINKSTNLKGIQIGLWNKNQKTSLPFINWNFKS